MNKLRVGVIGAGYMGENHIRIYNELLKDIEFVGFFDIDEKRSHNLSNKYKIPSFSQVDDLLDHVDAVTIAVPTSLHYKYGLLCANKKKHILMEKPLCKTQKEAHHLIDLCKKNKLILQVGHIERFNPAIQELPKILKNEQILFLDFHRMSPYDIRFNNRNVIHDFMTHDLDIMNYLIDADIHTISAQGRSVYPHDYIDYAQALIGFSNNILVSLTASRVTADKIRTLTIHTKNSYISVDYINSSITITRQNNFNLEIGYDIAYQQQNITEKVYVQKNNPLKNQIYSFIQSIQTKQAPVVDGLAALKVLEIADKITEIIHLK